MSCGRSGAKTLFATHYHELTELEGKLPGVNNYCIAVKESGEDIVSPPRGQSGTSAPHFSAEKFRADRQKDLHCRAVLCPALYELQERLKS